jgi:hypothetical protein
MGHTRPGKRFWATTASSIPAGNSRSSVAALRGWTRPPPIRYACLAPRRGSKIIAQGKTAALPRRSAAKAGGAALGNAHPEPTLPFFWFGAPAGWRAKPEKGEQIIFRSEPRAAFVPRLPWATIISSLQDFSLARIVDERPGPPASPCRCYWPVRTLAPAGVYR